MTLTDKHIAYENVCRQMFIGQTICSVIYAEVSYQEDENGQDINSEPNYKTKYPDVDTLDHAIYFKTADKTIYIFWDNTFISYGLQSKQIDLTVKTNDFEQKWDVSSENKWTPFIGQKIIDFKIIWEETWSSNLDGTNKIYTTYPQTFVITTQNGQTIVLSAAEIAGDEKNKIYPLMDNLIVTTNMVLAGQLKII